MKIKDLKLNTKNPRQIKGERLALLKKSIQDFEKMLELRPIIIDENNVVLGGNMRLQALKALGYKDIPDKWVKKTSDLTEGQKKEFIVKDNIGFGEWDFDILANEFDYEKLTEWGFEEFEMKSEGHSGADPFADEGIAAGSGYGVIVMCSGQEEQQAVYERLTGEGMHCKVVVV